MEAGGAGRGAGGSGGAWAAACRLAGDGCSSFNGCPLTPSFHPCPLQYWQNVGAGFAAAGKAAGEKAAAAGEAIGQSFENMFGRKLK